MFGISWEQISGQVRGVLMGIAGIAIGRGLVDEHTATVLVGVIMWVLGLLWSGKVNTQHSIVSSVDAMAKDPYSPVAGVITVNSPAGRELAQSIPGNTTAPADSPAAATIAKS